jgi:hypothetical protein
MTGGQPDLETTAQEPPGSYEPNPRYEPVGGTVKTGWTSLANALPDRPIVVALDGPATLDWDIVVRCLADALDRRGVAVSLSDVRRYFSSWNQILERTASSELPDDPDYATLPNGTIADIFDSMPVHRPPTKGALLVFGPGAGLVSHDVLWYADLPKRYAEAAIVNGTAQNLGQPASAGHGTTKRLFFIDWPLLDRHRDAISAGIDCWIDTQRLEDPAWVDGATLRRTAADLAQRPFRTRPTFNTTPWGGHWAQRHLGVSRQALNTALGYELIAPESGVLVGYASQRQVEIPFQLIVAQQPVEVLGPPIHRIFGTSFPIRFDYLDTVDGGNLSVHCHPRPEYMRRVFGWFYTQHETYYVMVGGEGCQVFLGLRDDIDIDAFYRDAHEAVHNSQPFEIDRYVRTFPAHPHQLFMIPAGTPHGSGEGNVVLEVSATPYLYSLRFYDWLRRDADGRQRPVPIDHAFANLDTGRKGAGVERDLIQAPLVLREGQGWQEELLGTLPEMFFEVRRIVLESGDAAEDDTVDRFHVVNVVKGDGVMVETNSGYVHRLNYAETMILPAAVGGYRLRRIGSNQVRVVKSLVQ